LSAHDDGQRRLIKLQGTRLLHNPRGDQPAQIIERNADGCFGTLTGCLRAKMSVLVQPECNLSHPVAHSFRLSRARGDHTGCETEKAKPPPGLKVLHHRFPACEKLLSPWNCSRAVFLDRDDRAEKRGIKITRARLTSSTAAPWIAGQWGQGGITGCRDDARRQELFLSRAKKS